MDSEQLNYPQLFIEAAQKNQGNKFLYICPKCSVEIGLRQRVTLNQRKCPGCGHPISVFSIDQQIKTEWERKQEETRRIKEEWEAYLISINPSTEDTFVDSRKALEALYNKKREKWGKS